MALPEIVKQLVVAAEVMGWPLSEVAAEVIARELEPYGAEESAKAIRACMRAGGKLTLDAIVSRIDFGHPGPEEAWAMCPRDEASTVVWTDEIAEAFGVAAPLLETDEVGARMAFRETYTRLLQQARDERRRPKWNASLGHDRAGRESALRDAVALGRLSRGHAEAIVGPLALPGDPRVNVLVAGVAAKLSTGEDMRRKA